MIGMLWWNTQGSMQNQEKQIQSTKDLIGIMGGCGLDGGGGDCANFVSQVLHAAGIPMNDEWYFRKKREKWRLFGFIELGEKNTSEWSKKWTVADEHYRYFRDKRYSVEDIKITSPHQLVELHKSGKVKPGDLLYWDWDGDGVINHATVITHTKQALKYSGHTNDTFNGDVYTKFLEVQSKNNNKTIVRVVRMKDEIPVK